MKKVAPYIFIAFAVIFLIIMFSDNSYSQLSLIKENIELQNKRNAELRREVLELRSRVYRLQNNPRALEKAARNKLGLARPGEEIYIFEKR